MKIQKLEGSQYYEARQGDVVALGYSFYEAIVRLLTKLYGKK